jgi:hypothetical protein
MKNKLLRTLAFAFSFALPFRAFALGTPTVDPIPSSVNANTYTLVIHTEAGAKVTVVGGTSDVAPMTDGAGDDIKDGVVRVMVGLVQNEDNVFSITAEKDGVTSGSLVFEIHESSNSGPSQDGPDAPKINPIPDIVKTAEYLISGHSEAKANIYVKRTDGSTEATTQADGAGLFQVTVTLEEEKRRGFWGQPPR